MSDRLPDDAARALRDDGFAVIPGPVAAGALPPLAAAYDAAMAAGAGSSDYREGSTTTRLHDLVSRDPAFDPIWMHPPLLHACALVVGPRFRLSALLGRTLRAGAAAQALHADLARDDPARPMLGFIVMVDAFSPDNGATRFVPGSHRWPEAPGDVAPERLAALGDGVPACGAAGSMIVFDASTWHGHGTNASGAPRRSIQGYFVPRDAPAGDDLAARLPPGTLARLGPLARGLLGR